jgi:hypothetical protein
MRVIALAVTILGMLGCDGGGLGTGADATGVDGGGAAVDVSPVTTSIDSGTAITAVDADNRPCTQYNWVINGDYPNGILVCVTHEPWQPCNDVLPCTDRIDAGTR